MFILCLDYILLTSKDLKENCLTSIKARSRQSLIETMTDADNTDNLVLLTNTPAQAESLQQNQEKAVGGTGHYANINKTEYMF